jgi:hypothetical protein
VLALQQHSFPGNVRELEHLMERASVQAGGRAITGDDIRNQIGSIRAKKDQEEREDWLALPFQESVANWKRRLIENAIEAAGGNKADAAPRLGIHRRLLYEKLQQFGITWLVYLETLMRNPALLLLLFCAPKAAQVEAVCGRRASLVLVSRSKRAPSGTSPTTK